MLALAFFLQTAGGFSATTLMLPLLVIVMMFVMIVPNQRRQKKWAQMLSEIKPGDKVTTNGGIRGTIISVKDDAVQLRIPPDNIKLEFAKNAIATVTTSEEEK